MARQRGGSALAVPHLKWHLVTPALPHAGGAGVSRPSAGNRHNTSDLNQRLPWKREPFFVGCIPIRQGPFSEMVRRMRTPMRKPESHHMVTHSPDHFGDRSLPSSIFETGTYLKTMPVTQRRPGFFLAPADWLLYDWEKQRVV
jgi:hypothetical protein